MDITIEGPKVLFTIPVLGGISVTETIVNMWIVMAFIAFLCKFLTWKMKKIPKGKQVLAELYVTYVDQMVRETMGKQKESFAPYLGTLFLFSLFSSLSSLLALRPPTGDLNTVFAWALITFVMIQYTGIRSKGVKGYLKGFAEPVAVMLPMNVLSEVANPISMSFRHFGNIASGIVISVLVYGALGAASTALCNFNIPFLQLGLPAVLSLYFDLFTSVLQAFVFCMLTMAFVSNAE